MPLPRHGCGLADWRPRRRSAQAVLLEPRPARPAFAHAVDAARLLEAYERGSRGAVLLQCIPLIHGLQVPLPMPDPVTGDRSRPDRPTSPRRCDGHAQTLCVSCGSWAWQADARLSKGNGQDQELRDHRRKSRHEIVPACCQPSSTPTPTATVSLSSRRAGSSGHRMQAVGLPNPGKPVTNQVTTTPGNTRRSATRSDTDIRRACGNQT